MVAVPLVAETSPSKKRKEMVLTETLGAIRPVTRPGSIRAENCETAVMFPYCFVTPENSSTWPSDICEPLFCIRRFVYPLGKQVDLSPPHNNSWDLCWVTWGL